MPLTAEDLKSIGIELDEEKTAALLERHNSSLAEETNGLIKKRDELLGQERKLKDQLKQYDGIDPVKHKEIMSMLDQNEEARLIAEGKTDEVLKQRTERMRNDYETQLKAAKEQAEKAVTFSNKFRGKVLSDEVRMAGAELGVIPSALEDAILRSGNLFEVDDEGNVVPTESAGLDAKGNPLTLKTWLESMKETAPHWFPVVKGGGATGNNGGKANRKWGDYNEQERAILARENPEEFNRLKQTKGA